MTNPVILLGTQSNGETLPVQVDGTGRLVAEGLPGSEGPPGSPGQNGQDGAPGGDFPLPPDPYEGAVLGWLNGELAWLGTPPVPIPPGRYGPIVAWDPNDGRLELEGEMPDVGTGVYLYQCDEAGELILPPAIHDVEWSEYAVWSDGYLTGRGADKAFDGFMDTNAASSTQGSDSTLTLNNLPPWGPSDTLEIWIVDDGDAAWSVEGTGVTNSSNLVGNEWSRVTVSQFVNSFTLRASGAKRVHLTALRLNGNLIVDKSQSLNLRVNTIFGNNIVGHANRNDFLFTIGEYILIPEQRVAPWVLRGNDSTSLIDDLRWE